MPNTLLEVRKNFVKLCGRLDLVIDTSAWVDNGANFFINAAQRWLDRKAESLNTITRYHKDVAIGAYSMAIPGLRVVDQVWVTTSELKWQLEKKTQTWLRENYATSPMASIEKASPLYYARTVTTLAPPQQGLTDGGGTPYTAEFTRDFEGITFGDSWSYTGLMWLPPTLEAVTITVYGKFYSKTLAVDADKSYWTEDHMELLVAAAAMTVESFYRNTEGYNDWLSVVNTYLHDLDVDLADQESTDLGVING